MEDVGEEVVAVAVMARRGAGLGEICCGSKFRVCMACRA